MTGPQIVTTQAGTKQGNVVGSAAATKPKRVRTGCLTCRERHLKCDEAQPICQNCRKSNRQCKRGVRLNFIDTQVKLPPVMAPVHDWNVHFHDESREIASEYKGGSAKYGALEEDGPTYPIDNSAMIFDFGTHHQPPLQHQGLPPIHGIGSDPFQEDQMALRQQGDVYHRHTHSHHSESTFSGSNLPTTSGTSYEQAEVFVTSNVSQHIRDANELFFMQTFVEEVGPWMDSTDPYKHFSQILPHHAIGNNMLYNAFLACGARHLVSLKPSEYSDDLALPYYQSSTNYLLQALSSDGRDGKTCAATAVILNVYEMMSQKFQERMTHLAGARDLIRECRWNAQTTGLGAACFWLNIGMELLSCLARKSTLAWDPDDWGLDLNFDIPSQHDEVWTHRIVYIVAKICNFCAGEGAFDSSHASRKEHTWKQGGMQQWQSLKDLIDLWDRRAPRSMRPVGWVESFETKKGSRFPEVWLIKRTATMARLLFHTGLLLLAQSNPATRGNLSPEMRQMQMDNAMTICGLVVHNKDRGVASVAIRSAAIAGEILTDHEQRKELLTSLEHISRTTGWNVQVLAKELQNSWGWHSPSRNDVLPHSQHFIMQQTQAISASPQGVSTPQMRLQATYQPSTPQQLGLQRSASHRRQMSQPQATAPAGSRNPMAIQHFTMPQAHPYGNHFIPPTTMSRHNSANYF